MASEVFITRRGGGSATTYGISGNVGMGGTYGSGDACIRYNDVTSYGKGGTYRGGGGGGYGKYAKGAVRGGGYYCPAGGIRAISTNMYKFNFCGGGIGICDGTTLKASFGSGGFNGGNSYKGGCGENGICIIQYTPK